VAKKKAREWQNPFGDGKTSQRVIDIVYDVKSDQL
jgi:UDP-N-acetylglucosamine 2-epimerase